MRGKTEEQVRSERAELVNKLENPSEGDKYRVIDTVFPDFSGEGNIPLKYLAKSLEYLADSDVAVFMDGWESARGCVIEHQVCLAYDIPIKYAKDI